MDNETLDCLLSGSLDKLIPLPKRVVRLFISSTFTDMTLERNSLMERVYPKLKNYCREQHGLDFQVVDMRWGVRDEATDDHQTVGLCSREIRNCQRMSLGPNFVALIGDKYGFRPLCNRIKSSEYRALRRCLIELDINTDFLDTWYKEDLNAVPAEYLLQPISSILKNFTNKAEPELQSVDRRIWQAIQERIHQLLLIGSGRLVAQGRLSEEDRALRYSISVTEREVIEGCLNVKDAKQRCLVYVRSIRDLSDHLRKCLDNLAAFTLNSSPTQQTLAPISKPPGVTASNGAGCVQGETDRRGSQSRKASLKIGSDSINLTTSQSQNAAERKIERSRKLIGRFVDLIAHKNVWSLDEEAQAALKELKDKKLSAKFGSEEKNFNLFEVGWHEQEGVSLKVEEHKKYLQDLTDHFYKSLTSMIRKSAKSDDQQLKTGLLGEVLQHSHHANHVSRTFAGRTEELAQMKAYILGNQSSATDGMLPMFVYGVGGSGKTSFLARTATLIGDWLQQQHEEAQEKDEEDDDDDEQRDSLKSAKLVWRDHSLSVCIICRFCGTTPSSSSMVGLLGSVCRQLQYNFYQFASLASGNSSGSNPKANTIGRDDAQLPFEPTPDDFVRLVFTFRQLLDNCRHRLHRRRLFVIILDSLEHLSPPAENSVEVKYSWLTSVSKLPPNVRLIVSCSSESSNVVWKKDFAYLKGHFLESHFDIEQGAGRGRGQLGFGKGESSEARQTNIHLKQRLEKRKWSLGAEASKTDERLHSLRLITVSAVRLMQAKRDNYTRRSALQPSEAKSRVWIIHIVPLGPTWARRVLQNWLAECGRNLSQQQWSIVEKSFARCSRPLFIKLAFGEVINWKSYSMQSDTRGLTFGSALLEKKGFTSGQVERFECQKIAAALAKLDENRSEDLSNSSEYRWRLISFEQEWLSYLESKSREGSMRDETAQLKNQMTIRIGADSSADSPDKSGYSAKLTAAATTIGSSSSIVASSSSSICHLSSTIDDAICQLLARIEIQHGFILTKHSLSYLTAARNGICENELEDLLSLDDVVLDDVFQYHLPPVRRIPPLLWTRIRNDLPDYLSERDADGIVVNWHHEQFRDATRRRYMSPTDVQQVLYIHSMMADYFLGRWADKPKPFKCTKQQVQMAAEQLESAIQQSLRDSQSFGRRASGVSVAVAGGGGGGARLSFGSPSIGLARGAAGSVSVHERLRASNQSDQRFQWMEAKADRRVPHQPLVFVGVSVSGIEATRERPESAELTEVEGTAELEHWAGEAARPTRRRYNMRKLTELPHHLIRAARFQDLANEVLFNYKWLFCSLDALGMQSVLSDFEEATQSMNLSIADLTSKETAETPAAAGLYSGSTQTGEQVETDDLESSRSLMRQVELLASAIRLSSSALAHGQTHMLAPQLIGRLLPVLGTKSSGSNRQSRRHLARLLEQCDRDGRFDNALLPLAHCLQSPEGLQCCSLEGHAFAVLGMALTRDRRHLLAVSNKFIMWDISTGEVSRIIEPKLDGSIMSGLKLGGDNKYALAYTNTNLILLLEVLTQQVTSFRRLTTLPACDASNSPSASDRIKGLELIDKRGATLFIVWTEKSWFLMSVVNDSSNPLAAASHRASISIRLEFCVELAEFKSLSEPTRGIHYLRAVAESYEEENPSGSHLVVLGTRLIDEKSLRISTVRVSKCELAWNLDLWSDEIENITAMCCNESLNRIAFVDSKTGELYLRRRRKFFWSKRKCLLSRQAANYSDPVVCLQMSFIDGSGENEKARENNDRRESGQLSDFEHADQPESELAEQEKRYSGRSKRERTYVTRSACQPAMAILMLRERSVTVIQPGEEESRCDLELPRDVRNIQVEPNRCQMRALLMAAAETSVGRCLILSSNRRLLFYSLRDGGRLMRSVEAHSARIIHMLPVCRRQDEDEREQATESYLIASASLDKSVKIWNLANLAKDSRSLDKLSSPIETIHLSSQTSWAICLARNECGIFDWRTLELLARIRPSDLVTQRAEPSPIVSCGLSSNGRYLCLATSVSIYLCPLDATIKGLQRAAATSLPPTNGPIYFEQNLNPGELIKRIVFFQQDSRLLLIVACTSNNQQGSSEESAARKQRILVHCLSVPDGRHIYTLDQLAPKSGATSDHPRQVTRRQVQPAASEGALEGAKLDSRRRLGEAGGTTLLPVLTRDQAHIVTVEFANPSRANGAPSSSIQLSAPLQLSVYSARDGRLSHSIGLDELEISSSQPARGVAEHQGPVARRAHICIGADQFTELKAVQYLDRQSIVALMDRAKGRSFLVDVHLRQLMVCTSIWNGQLTSDGRYGLSCGAGSPSGAAALGGRSVAGMAPTRVAIDTNRLPHSSSTSSLLELLEMRQCSPVRSLLTSEALAGLSSTSDLIHPRPEADFSSRTASKVALGAGFYSNEASCGFNSPADSHVYYCDQRRRRLLLVRLADGRLIANYTLPAGLVSLGWASDGFVLVAGLADGSLLSLAIVDPSKSDSLIRLSSFPSRKRA